MKLLDIAFKDMVRSFRSAAALFFMFGVPVLTTLLFFFAFGGTSGGDGFELPTVQVRLVNLDEPDEAYGFAAGEMLAEILQSQDLEALMDVDVAEDASDARAAVDRQEADVAVIIPADLTEAVIDPEGQAAVEVYQDPTLTLGPSVVKGIVRRIVDAFAGSKIAVSVAHEQLSERGLTADAATMQRVSMQYAEWSASMWESQGTAGAPLLGVRSPAGVDDEPADVRLQVVTIIMTGMMVFYVFFTGASSSEAILREEKEGTLSRLFTTPTPQSTILGGNFIATFATIVVQVMVLMAFSRLVFGIQWGRPLPLAVATLALVILASSFGIFLTSLIKDVRQTGVVFGGVMTVAGMVGISRIFTIGVPDTSQTAQATRIVSLLVPQGWAMRAWRIVLDGGGVADMLSTVLVMLALGAIFFVIGVWRFRKRFA